MSSISFNYSELANAIKEINNASRKMDDYAQRLSRESNGKFFGIEGGANSNTSNSEYFVKKKINQLNKTKQSYSAFANRLEHFSSNLRNTDQKVASRIKQRKQAFINSHDYVKSGATQAFIEWLTELKNSCPILQGICDALNSLKDEFKDFMALLKYWYVCGGGKELIDVVLACVGVVLLTAIAVVTVLSGGAFLACLGAAIAAVNAVINLKNSIKAMQVHDEGDPAWARIYAGRDSLQDDLRDTNWDNKTFNKLSGILASTIDGVQLICAGYDFANIFSPEKANPGKLLEGLKEAKKGYKLVDISHDVIAGEKTIKEGAYKIACNQFDELKSFDKFDSIVKSFSGMTQIDFKKYFFDTTIMKFGPIHISPAGLLSPAGINFKV